MKSYVKKILYNTISNIPYIPNFRDPWNVLKVLLVSILICILYSFAKINKASDIVNELNNNFLSFYPYVITMLTFLYFFSNIIKKFTATYSIIIILILNLISVYFVFSVTNNNYLLFFESIDMILKEMAVSIGILFFFLIYFDWREKNLDPINTIAKLTFLQSKMRPHFLFNTLNTVNSLIKKEPEKARKMINNLSDLLRVSIKDELNSMHSLKDEIELCEKYLDIEKVRLNNRLQIKWTYNDGIDAVVPKLILQPLIENSILHGIQLIENGGLIEINIQKKLNNTISIEIKNPTIDGKQIKTNTNNISINNIKERLKIYYKGDIIFQSYKMNNDYYTFIQIPYLKNYIY